MKPTVLPSYTSFTFVLDEFPLLRCSKKIRPGGVTLAVISGPLVFSRGFQTPLLGLRTNRELGPRDPMLGMNNCPLQTV